MTASSNFRPMLGAPVESIAELRFPLLASYKLDGIRAIWRHKEFFSRTLKTIPNRNLQALFAPILEGCNGWDGELIWGSPNADDVYCQTNSHTMAHEASAERFKFFVFDNCELEAPFEQRHKSLHSIDDRVYVLEQVLIESVGDCEAYYKFSLEQGFEGLVLKRPSGPYKHGRSTWREHYMLKLKPFHDAEAIVIGFEERLHNANEATVDARGYTKRSSHQDNKIPTGTLGALVCKKDEQEFRIGTGFTENSRVEIWRSRDKYLGKIAKFKSLHIGVKDLPRHPVFLGWRDRLDS